MNVFFNSNKPQFNLEVFGNYMTMSRKMLGEEYPQFYLEVSGNYMTMFQTMLGEEYPGVEDSAYFTIMSSPKKTSKHPALGLKIKETSVIIKSRDIKLELVIFRYTQSCREWVGVKPDT